MSRYAKYDVIGSFLGKKFTVRGVVAFNEDNARKRVKDLIKFEGVEKQSPPKENPLNYFNDIFGL